MDLPLSDYQDDQRFKSGPLTNNSEIVEYSHIYEFQDSITGTQCVDGDVINLDAFITEFLYNDDAVGLESFIRTYVESDHLTADFELVKPALYMYMWESAILADAYEICLMMMELSGRIIPMLNPEMFKDLTVIYRTFWTTSRPELIDNVLTTIIEHDDIEILLMNAMYFLDQYRSNVELQSLTDAVIDVELSGVVNINHDLADVQTDIATGDLKGDVGGLELYENTQLPGDRFLYINPDRILQYLDEFEEVIRKTYDSPYRSIHDLACDAYDYTIFYDLRDAGVDFDSSRAPDLLSPRNYHYIEELGEVYDFDSARIPLGGVFGSVDSYARIM